MGHSRSHNDRVERALTRVEAAVNAVVAPAGSTDLSSAKIALNKVWSAVDVDGDLHSALKCLQRTMWQRADLFLNALSPIRHLLERWKQNEIKENGEKNART